MTLCKSQENLMEVNGHYLGLMVTIRMLPIKMDRERPKQTTVFSGLTFLMEQILASKEALAMEIHSKVSTE